MLEIERVKNSSCEYIEDLDLKIYQSKKGYRYNFDSISLVDFCVESIKETNLGSQLSCMDLGAGVGILSLLLARTPLFNVITAYEIQASLYDYAVHNVEINNLQEIISVKNKDYYNDKLRSEAQNYDIVICNPPYKKDGTGRQNLSCEKRLARHEINSNLNIIVKSLNYYLKAKGRGYLVYPSERLQELLVAFAEVNLTANALKFIHHDSKSESSLFMVELIKDRKSVTSVRAPVFVS